MSSIYTQLTEADLRLEKDLVALIPTTSAPTIIKPKLTGIKFSIFSAITLGVAAIVGVIYLHESLLLETKQRKALESSHVALSERTAALESAVEEQKILETQFRDLFAQAQHRDDVARNEIQRGIEKRRLEIADLQKKLKMLEEKVLAPAPVLPPVVLPALSPVMTAVPQVQEIKTAITAGTPVAGPVMPPAVGKQRVLTVNRQFKFVVINVGTEDGTKIGDKYIVKRDGKPSGALQIEKLYDNFSAATILEENSNAPIEVGDSITKAA
ncbi:MAG: hypothetical protein EXS63_01455 [Candidatus Omnitrophica bacterium]|nr:hypothetical protein [Candidatus Omnitrophota bacterium]